MGDSEPRQSRHLSLDNLAVNPRLARRLPPALACLYRALPVAEDGGHITVAMADPGDAAARQAIEAALGTTCCVVQGDAAVIDALLAEVWPEAAQRSLRLLVCARLAANEVQHYAQAMGKLLGAHVSHFQIVGDADAALDALAGETGRVGYDLVVLGESEQWLVERLLAVAADEAASGWLPGSLLLVRRPRWPLKKLLLVVQGTGADDAAVDWAVRLARSSAAAVTVLAWVLPTPTQRHGQAAAPQGLNDLLMPDTVLGQQMYRLSQRLVNWEIESTLRLCQGAPEQQIRREVAEGNYDLIAVAVEPLGPGRLWRELGALLLRRASQPVLIVKPT
jgi:nucleotide-binding universal stress UspA family protein